MKLNILVKTVMIASIFSGSIAHAEGLPTGKRQHKPIGVTKEIDKSSPMLMGAATSTNQVQDIRSAYRLCPDGTMINPGDKCPEKSVRR